MTATARTRNGATPRRKPAARRAKAPAGKAPAGKAPADKPARRSPSGTGSSEYLLRLYVAGHTPKSLQAFATLKQICETHLAGRYQIEVVDLVKNPALARGDQILALPTVVRQLPPPVKKLIGDFSNTERVLVGLDLRPMKLGGDI